MNIAVIGAGIVGLCTAYELALDGHTVSVFERNGAVAEEASFACAGHLAGSLSHPFSFPRWPSGSPMRALLAPSGIGLERGVTLRDLRWLWGWKMATRDHVERFGSGHKLISYSRQRLQTLAEQAPLAHAQSQGQLLLLKSDAEQLAYQTRLGVLNDLGAGAKILTPQEARALEPALGAQLPFHAALHFPNDAVANCRQFAQLLKDRLMEGGTRLHFGTTVTSISHTPGVQLHTDTMGIVSFDALVICAGTGAMSLQDPVLKRVTLSKLWSHSVSAQIREPLNAPRSAVIDHHQQISISRMGARLRVSGGAALGSTRRGQSEKITRLLFQTLQSHFPGAADFSRSMQTWKGASVFSPDALPLVGRAGNPGVWLNVAHGHNGWGMACGTARVIADQIAGREPEIDATQFNPARFQS